MNWIKHKINYIKKYFNGNTFKIYTKKTIRDIRKPIIHQHNKNFINDLKNFNVKIFFDNVKTSIKDIDIKQIINKIFAYIKTINYKKNILDTIQAIKNTNEHSETKPIKAIFMIIIVFFLVLFYESDRFYLYFDSIKSNLTNEKEEITVQRFTKAHILNYTISILDGISTFKKEIYLSEWQKIEDEFISEISSSPVLYYNDTVDDTKVEITHNNDEQIQNKKIALNLIEEEKEKKPKLVPPYKILILGDSNIAEAIGVALERDITKYQHCSVVRKGIYSSGLSRPDFYNWHSKIKDFIKRYKPNIMIILMGTNDGQALYSVKNKKFTPFYLEKKWKVAYENSAHKLMKIINDKDILTFWIGLPISESSKFNKKISLVNTIQQNTADTYNKIHYIGTWDLFRKGNSILSFYKNNKGKNIKVRKRDKIHLTTAAGKIFSKYVIKKMSQFIALENNSTPKSSEVNIKNIDIKILKTYIMNLLDFNIISDAKVKSPKTKKAFKKKKKSKPIKVSKTKTKKVFKKKLKKINIPKKSIKNNKVIAKPKKSNNDKNILDAIKHELKIRKKIVKDEEINKKSKPNLTNRNFANKPLDNF